MQVISTQNYDDYINSSYPYNSELFIATDDTAENTVDIELDVQYWTVQGTDSAKLHHVNTRQSIAIPIHDRVGAVLKPVYTYIEPPERPVDRFGNLGPYYHATIGTNRAISQFEIKYINNNSIAPLNLPAFPSAVDDIELYEPMYPEPIATGQKETAVGSLRLFGIYGDGMSPAPQVWDVTINIPCFKTLEDLEDYLRTGNLDNAIENGYRPADVSLFSTLWFWEYEEDTVNEKNQIIDRGDTDKKDFKLPDGYVVAWVRVATSIPWLTSPTWSAGTCIWAGMCPACS